MDKINVSPLCKLAIEVLKDEKSEIILNRDYIDDVAEELKSLGYKVVDCCSIWNEDIASLVYLEGVFYIILVLNYCDEFLADSTMDGFLYIEKDLDLNIAKLKECYPKMKAIYELEIETENDEELQDVIEEEIVLALDDLASGKSYPYDIIKEAIENVLEYVNNK